MVGINDFDTFSPFMKLSWDTIHPLFIRRSVIRVHIVLLFLNVRVLTAMYAVRKIDEMRLRLCVSFYSLEFHK